MPGTESREITDDCAASPLAPNRPDGWLMG